MTSKEHFLPLKRTDYFLYCGEKLISVNSLKTNDCDQEGEPALALDIYRMTFPKINNPNLRCYVDMYMKYEIKPHEINRYTILRRYIIHSCCLFFFSFLFFIASGYCLSEMNLKKKKEKKKRYMNEIVVVFRKHARSSIKKGGEQSIHPFVKKKIKEKNGIKIV